MITYYKTILGWLAFAIGGFGSYLVFNYGLSGNPSFLLTMSIFGFPIMAITGFITGMSWSVWETSFQRTFNRNPPKPFLDFRSRDILERAVNETLRREKGFTDTGDPDSEKRFIKMARLISRFRLDVDLVLIDPHRYPHLYDELAASQN